MRGEHWSFKKMSQYKTHCRDLLQHPPRGFKHTHSASSTSPTAALASSFLRVFSCTVLAASVS